MDDQTAEPDNIVLHLLRELRETMKGGFAELRSEMQSLRADVAADLFAVERHMNEQDKRTNQQIVGLRRAVVGYRSAGVGHGIQIGELEARVQRLETSR